MCFYVKKVLRILLEQLYPKAVRLQETLSRPLLSLTMIPAVLIFIRITLRRFCGPFLRTHENWEVGHDT